MKIQEFRQKYPQYDGIADNELATKLHAKYYSSMPFEEFADRFGVGKPTFQGEQEATGTQKPHIRFIGAVTEKPLEKIPFSPFPAAKLAGVINASRRLQHKDPDVYLNQAKVDRQARAMVTGPFGKHIPLEQEAKQIRQLDIKEIEKYLEEQEKQYTFGGQVGRIVSAIPAPMIEFLFTGGLKKLGSETAKQAGKRLLGKYAVTKVGKAAIATGGFAVGTTFRSAGMPQRAAEAILKRQTPQDIEVSDTGEIKITGPVDTPSEALWKGLADHYIEIASEQAGEVIQPVLGTVFRKLPFMGKLIPAIEKRWLSQGAGRTIAKFNKKIGTTTGFHGVLSEIGEEYLGDITRGLVRVDDFGAGPDAGSIKRIAAAVEQDTEMLPAMAVAFAIPTGVARVGAIRSSAPITEAVEQGNVTPERADEIAQEIQTKAEENGVSPEYIIGNIEVQREADRMVSRFPQKIKDQASLDELGLEIQAHLAGTEIGKGLNDWDVQWELYTPKNSPKSLGKDLGVTFTYRDLEKARKSGWSDEQIAKANGLSIEQLAKFDGPGKALVQILAPTGQLFDTQSREWRPDRKFAGQRARKAGEAFRHTQATVKRVMVHELAHLVYEPLITENGKRIAHTPEFARGTETMTKELFKVVPGKVEPVAETKSVPQVEQQSTKPMRAEQPKPKKYTKRQAQKLGHSLPKKLGWDDAQRRDFMQELVGKRSMKGMTPKEMNQVVNALYEQAKDQGLLPPEDYPETIVVNGREMPTQEFFADIEQNVANLPDLSQKRPKMRLRRRAEYEKTWWGTAKAVLTGIDNLSIPHLMRKLGAAKGGMFGEIGVTGWRRSVHQIASVFRGGVSMLNDAIDAAQITNRDLTEISSSADSRMELIKRGRELIGKPKTKPYHIKINSKDFVFEMDELMDMYLASLQDTGTGHIENGGFVVRGYETGPIDEETMDSIRDVVDADPRALAIMNAAIKIADEYNAPQLNYTNQGMNPESPEPIADRKNYWHLEPKQPKKIKGKPTYSISLLENKNILKPRTGGKQSLVIRGFFNRFFAVQYAVSEYVGMAEEMRLMNMILNHGPVMDALETKGYTPVRDNLKTLLEWVQSKGSTTTSTDKLVGRILHGAFRAVLHYSPEVIASQYMSTGHYMAYTDAKYAPLLAVPPTPGQIHEMLDHNPVVWQRYYAGGQSAELAELGQLDVSLRLLTGKHADLNKTGIAAQMTDLAAFCQGWKLAKAIVQDTTNLEVGSPKFFDAVNDKAEELWDTQPSWDKWNKSINTSRRGVARLPFLFRSYFEKSLMMLHSANATYAVSEKTATDKAQWGKIYGAVLGSQMATALIRTFIGWGVWRQRKTVWDFIGAMIAAPFAMVSIVGGYLNRVVGNIVRILGGQKRGFEGEPISTLPSKTVEDLLFGISRLGYASADYLAGDEEKAKQEAETAVNNLTIAIGTMEGIPVRQVRKLEKALGEKKKRGGKRIIR